MAAGRQPRCEHGKVWREGWWVTRCPRHANPNANTNTTQTPRVRCRLKAGYPNQRVAVIIEGMYAVYRDEQNAQKRAYREHVLNVCADGHRRNPAGLAAGCWSKAHGICPIHMCIGAVLQGARGAGAGAGAGGTKARVDAAVLRIQVDMGIHVYMTYDSQETNEMLVALTKAVSLAPIRYARPPRPTRPTLQRPGPGPGPIVTMLSCPTEPIAPNSRGAQTGSKSARCRRTSGAPSSRASNRLATVC
jgi:hypothetical protein